jgi:hypothetical protein
VLAVVAVRQAVLLALVVLEAVVRVVYLLSERLELQTRVVAVAVAITLVLALY